MDEVSDRQISKNPYLNEQQGLELVPPLLPVMIVKLAPPRPFSPNDKLWTCGVAFPVTTRTFKWFRS